MKKVLLFLVMMSVLLVSCVKIGDSQGKAGIQSPSDNRGLAQTPDEMQSLPGGQSVGPGSLPSLQGGGQPGSMGGFGQPSGSINMPAGQPVPPAIGQFNLSGQGGNQPPVLGVLPPSSSGSAPSSGMASLVPSQSGSASSGGAGTGPYFEAGGDLYADTPTVNAGEAVFLGWRVANADEYTLERDGKLVLTIPRDRPGTFVVPDMPGVSKYTLTAKNSSGSISQSVEVNVLSKGQRPAFDRSLRCRTFMVYPKIVKKGEPVYVFWNVLDAQDVLIDNNFTGSISGKPDVRDFMKQTYGMEQYWPYQNTDFRLTHGSGPYSSSTYGTCVCYVDVQ